VSTLHSRALVLFRVPYVINFHLLCQFFLWKLPARRTLLYKLAVFEFCVLSSSKIKAGFLFFFFFNFIVEKVFFVGWCSSALERLSNV
jgi:hypothetical protein